ncbi:MAG: NPCBM/NEW2 domain-containing protein [Clostridia bacterium]|nr:NPCBM/NEW2 domain-containing protein [Clostridia bacterium]
MKHNRSLPAIAVLLAVVMIAGSLSAGIRVSAAGSGTYTLAEDMEPVDAFTIDGSQYWIGETGMTPGTPIHIGNSDYTHGISFHPASEGPAYLTYNVEGRGFKTFYAVVGKDRASGRDVGGDRGIKGSKISAEVWADGVKIAESGNLPYPETYTFKVNIQDAKEVKLVVTDGGDSIYCDTTSWGNALFSQESADEFTVPAAIENATVTEAPTEEPTPAPTNPPDISEREKVYLSDIAWKAAEIYPAANGGVPTRDGNLADEELWICGEFFEKGVCMHAQAGSNSYLEVDLDGLGFNTFAAYVGTAESDQYDVTMASVHFIFIVDGKEKLRTDLLKADTEPTLVTVDIAGAKLLRIEMDNGGDGISGDWGALGNAVLARATDVKDIYATPAPTATPEPTPTKAPTEEPQKTGQAATPAASENGGAGDNTPGGSSETDKKKSNTGLIIGIAVGAAAAAAVIAVIALRAKKRK